MRPVIIGESPGTANPRLPLDPSTKNSLGSHLQSLSDRDIVHEFDLVNLVFEEPTRWSRPAAKTSAEHLRPLLGGRLVVFLGRRVSCAFDNRSQPYSWEWHRGRCLTRGFWGVRVPHPSGLNRNWNEESAKRDIRCFFSLLPHPDAWTDSSPRGSLVTATSIAELVVRVDEQDILGPPVYTLGQWACTVRSRVRSPREHRERREIQPSPPLHP